MIALGDEPYPFGEPGGAMAFDYSEAEWRSITHSVQTVRTGPLTDDERSWLRWLAHQYIFDANLLEYHDSYRECYRNTIGKQWRKVERQTKRTLQMLREVKDITAERYLSAFSELGAEAERYANLFEWRKRVTIDMKEFAIPRMYYVYQVLNSWTELGGALTLSRNNKGKIQGPLSRYFFSVTRPVMKTFTPSGETLPDIVDRQKRLIRRGV